MGRIPPVERRGHLSPLDFIDSGDAFSTPNIVLYGPPKIGKTVAACSAPGPILHVNAEGPDSIAFSVKHFGEDKIRSAAFRGRADLTAVAEYLRGDGQDVKTVVLDTIGSIYTLLLDKERARDPRHRYQAVNEALKGHLTYLFNAPVNVVVVAHEQLVENGDFTESKPLIPGRQVGPHVEQHATIVGYCAVVVDKNDEERRVAQLIPGKGRTGGDRTGFLGAIRELDLTEWIETIHREKTAQDEPAQDELGEAAA